MPAARVLCVGRNGVFLRSLAAFVREHGGYPVASAQDFESALPYLRHDAALVLLISLGLPSCGDLALIDRYRRARPDSRIVTIGLAPTADYARALTAAGVDAWVDESRLMTELLPALDGVLHAT